MKWIALVVVLAGCDSLFGLDHLGSVDARGDTPSSDTPSSDSPVDGPPEACPGTYIAVVNAPPTSRYRNSSGSQSWDTAAADCNNDTVTHVTHLAVFETTGEMNALRFFVNTPTPWMVLVGFARDTIAQGGDPTMFTSVTGIPLSPTSPLWATNEPDNGGGPSVPEETIVFFKDDKNLTDGLASFPMPYLCECDGVPANQVFHTVD